MANKNKDIVIVSALRTSFGKYCGSLRDINYSDLGATPMREVLKRVNVPGKTVGEVFWGVSNTSAYKDPDSPNAARQSLIMAGLPHETSSISLDMAGISSMHAIMLAAMTMKLGEIDCAIAGGATLYSPVPMAFKRLRSDEFYRDDVKTEGPIQVSGYKDFNPVAVDCDNVAIEYGVDRVEQDEWAFRSHMNYGMAWNAGKFKEEILPLSVPREKGNPIVLDIDEQYSPHITMDELARFETVYGTKTITAGNSTELNDGASAILLMTREKAIEMGLQPLATVIASVSIATNARRTPEGPAFAMQMVCKKAGLTLEDIDVIEVNEDFTCIPLVSLRIVAGDNKKKLQELKDKTNINGSAIAIGHPSSATGARIIMGLMYELRRRDGGYALGTLCGSLAQADACIIKVE